MAKPVSDGDHRKCLLALTLDGSTRWPSAKQLLAFGTTRQIGGPSAIKQILAQIAEAMSATMVEIRKHIRAHPEFEEIGGRMLTIWEEGIREGLMIR